MQRSKRIRVLAMAGAFCVLLALVALGAGAMSRTREVAHEAACPIRLSELQSANGGCPDAEGKLRDWIEITNTSAYTYDLSGCGLSDDPLEIKYFFPDGTVLDAGAYLVVHCERGASGPLLAPFALNRSGGETVCFFSADDVAVDSVKTVQLAKGEVYALRDGTWQVLADPTPGFENTDAGRAAYLDARGSEDCPVVITELMAANTATLPGEDGGFPDWVELTNTGRQSWDLTGYYLSQKAGDLMRWSFGELTLAPGERVIVWCDGRATGLHTDFTLAKGGESLYLTNPAGIPAGSVTWGALEDDEVWALDEEEGEYLVSAEPSPGYENTPAGALAAARDADISGGGLVISEAVVANFELLRQSDGEYYDWVELYNASGAPILLSDYTLTDDKDAPAQWRLPEVELAPGAYYVVICSGNEALTNESYVHANFSLNAQDERLYLYGAGGALRDYCRLRRIPTGGSYGRMPGETGWFYFDVPTPGTPNLSPQQGMAAAPTASVAQGVYNEVESLSVALTGEGKIYYTLDGSVPTEASALYKKPFKLTQTTVLRAVSVAPGTHSSEVSTFSYILNENHTLPVVSIAADPTALFGAKGIYNAAALSRYDVEIGGSMAFFDEKGSCAADCGLALHGASTRETRNKKSIKMVFRPRYDGALQYDIFGDGEITNFFSLTVRSGYMRDATLLRDSVCSTAAIQSSDNVLALKTRYCILYINGEYWGVYALREAYSREYAADQLGARKDTVAINRAPVRPWGDNDKTLRAFFNTWLPQHDLSKAEDYAYAASLINMDSLADWMILEIYFGNYDLPGNIRYIRADESDPWRYAFFDLDFGLRTKKIDWKDMMDTANQFGRLTTRVVWSETFQDKLFTRMAELFAGPLCEQTVIDILNGYAAEIAPELAREFERWPNGYGDLDAKVADLAGNIRSDLQSQCVDTLCKELRLDAAAIRARYFAGMELE